jgi:hypothetical protein
MYSYVLKLLMDMKSSKYLKILPNLGLKDYSQHRNSKKEDDNEQSYQYDINQNVSGLTNKNPGGKLVKSEMSIFPNKASIPLISLLAN